MRIVYKGNYIRMTCGEICLVPHGKLTKSQLNITNESQEVSPGPAGDHKAANAKARQTQDINDTNDPQKKNRLRTESKNILLEGLNRFHGTNLKLSSDLDQDTQIFGLHERPLNYPCIIF